MKFLLAFAVLAFFFGGNSFANQQVDCSNPGSCIESEADLEFAKLKVENVKEEWKKYRWGDEYREVTLTVSGYFPTLLVGKPIVGQEYRGDDGRTLFIMGSASDATAPSVVVNKFVIEGGKEKIRIYVYQGLLQDKKTAFLGEF